MALLAVAEELPLKTHVTIEQACKIKQANYQAMRKWIVRNHVPVFRIGDVLLVRVDDLQKYRTR